MPKLILIRIHFFYCLHLPHVHVNVNSVRKASLGHLRQHKFFYIACNNNLRCVNWKIRFFEEERVLYPLALCLKGAREAGAQSITCPVFLQCSMFTLCLFVIVTIIIYYHCHQQVTRVSNLNSEIFPMGTCRNRKESPLNNAACYLCFFTNTFASDNAITP